MFEAVGLEVRAIWCPTHRGLYGNEAADSLARVTLAGPVGDPPRVASHARRTMESTLDRSNHWLAWFTSKSHGYKRKRTRRTQHLEVLSRDEFALLIRLRSDKGWSAGGTHREDPLPCVGCRQPRSSDHLLRHCEAYQSNRPGLGKSIQKDRDLTGYLSWMREHGNLGLGARIFAVEGVAHRVYDVLPKPEKRDWGRRDCPKCGNSVGYCSFKQHVDRCAGSSARGNRCAACGKFFTVVKLHERSGGCAGARS